MGLLCGQRFLHPLVGDGDVLLPLRLRGTEIGALTEIILQRISTPPAVIFDNVPGLDPNRRVLANMLETLERTALTLNLPLDLKTIPLIDALRAKLRTMQASQALTRNAKQVLALDLARMPDGNVLSLPALCAVGREPGPTLLVLAGVHGDEYEGIVAIPEIFRQADRILSGGRASSPGTDQIRTRDQS